MKNKLDFTQGKILSPLIRFSVPVLLALALQAMYGAVDLLIVGQFSTRADVSAVSTGAQILQTISGVISGFTMATTILIGMKIGQKKPEDAGKIIGVSIMLFSIIAIVITVIMTAFSDQIALLMNAPQEAFKETVAYVRICSLGFIFIIAYNVFGGIFRGIGDSKTPLVTVGIACAVNIVGDLLLIGVFDMASSGAAIATVFAQAVSVLISIIIVRGKALPFSFTKKDIRLNKKTVGKIVRTGTPIALQDGLVGISFLVVLSIVNDIGINASAGVGIAEKLCMFLMLVPIAFMQSMSAFVAQNIGAGKPDRAKKTMVYGMIVSVCFGLVLFAVTYLFGDKLSMIFTDDMAVIDNAFLYLKAYAYDCILTSFLFSFIGYFNGCSKTTFVMLQGIFGAFCVRIPVSYIVSRFKPVSLFMVGMATPCSTLIQIILCVIYFVITDRHSRNSNISGNIY